MSYYDFPHTRNYDTDLGYLINKYQELLDEINNVNVDGLKEDVEVLKADDNTNKQNIATNTDNINNHTIRITDLENADFLTNVRINSSATVQVIGGEKVDGVQNYTINVIGSQPANLTSNLELLNNNSELPIIKSLVISLDEATNKIKLASTSYVNGSETTSESTINLSPEEFKIVDNTLMLAKNYLEVSAAEELFNQKQDLLESGVNIKTVNNESLLGNGNIELATMNDVNELQSLLADIIQPNAGSHNAIYRGKFLGNSVTAEQYQALKDGTFTDLFIGDYWTIGGINYRIAAFDYYLRCGDIDLTTHHAVIVPDSALYNHVMNDTITTDGGYVGSKMYTEGLEQAKTTIKVAFSGHVFSHRNYFTNAVANGKPSACAWYDSEVDLMCEEMVYGGGIFRPTSDGSTIPANYRIEKSQLPLFTHRPDLISNRVYYWLRDVISATHFANVSDDGYASCDGAKASSGVRPAFCIYGGD